MKTYIASPPTATIAEILHAKDPARYSRLIAYFLERGLLRRPGSIVLIRPASRRNFRRRIVNQR